MNIKQLKKFYKEDGEKYIITRNKNILCWIKNRCSDGYNPCIDIKNLQSLIDNLTNWYEIKYPDRTLNENKNMLNCNDVEELSKNMTFKQLLYRLPQKQLDFIECGYRSYSCGQTVIRDKNNNYLGMENNIIIYLKQKSVESNMTSEVINKVPYITVVANSNTGEIKNISQLEYIIGNNIINIQQLFLLLIENYHHKIDCTGLRNCIKNHNDDMELRNKILQLVVLKLFYSKNTTPENGYKRALIFIEEFNENLGINLNSKEIDEIREIIKSDKKIPKRVGIKKERIKK